MKLFKPEYNENVVDVDALEKLRIQQEGETERNLVLQQELTKREAIKQKEETKRDPNDSNIRLGFIIASAVFLVIAAIAGAIDAYQYLDVLKSRVESQTPKCPPVPKCPELSCQPVPVNK